MDTVVAPVETQSGWRPEGNKCRHVQRFTYADIKMMLADQGFSIVAWRHSYHFLGQIVDLAQWMAFSFRKNKIENRYGGPSNAGVSGISRAEQLG